MITVLKSHSKKKRGFCDKNHLKGGLTRRGNVRVTLP